MDIMYQILRQLTTVGQLLLLQMIGNKRFLQSQIAYIALVFQHDCNDAGPPLVAGHRRDFHLVQLFADQLTAHAVQIVAEDHPDNFRFFRDNFQSSAFHFVPVNAEEAGFAPLKVVADAPLAVFRNAVALFLRKRSEDGKHQLSIPVHRVNILFFEKHIHVQRFQFPHRFQQRYRISGEATETFDDNHVDLAVSAVRQQPLEVLSFLCCAGHFIRVNASKNPIRIALNQIAEVADLCGERMQHRVLYAGNSRIGGYALFPGLLSAPPAWFDE